MPENTDFTHRPFPFIHVPQNADFYRFMPKYQKIPILHIELLPSFIYRKMPIFTGFFAEIPKQNADNYRFCYSHFPSFMYRKILIFTDFCRNTKKGQKIPKNTDFTTHSFPIIYVPKIPFFAEI